MRALALVLLLSSALAAQAITLRVTPQALERTLQQQLFRAPGGRYYLRGQPGTACFVYAEDPEVSFRGDRVVVHVKAHARLGTAVHGSCLGLSLNTEADVTLVPGADGDTINFHDARIENLTESRELNVFLEPFLSHKLPQVMRINAASLLRGALGNSARNTGYDLELTALQVRSMQVLDDALVFDLDGNLDVR